MSSAPKAEVLELSEMVAFQDGAIVSRAIVKADAGNVTLFAFDAGQELSPHTAPYDALAHILAGEAEVTVAGQVFKLHSGQAIIMPADVPHALKAARRFKMLLTMIRTPGSKTAS
jgi:quercetin dioxygenase-like cupin family protein